MKNKPVIMNIEPAAVLPGAEIRIEGDHFMRDGVRPLVAIDNLNGHVVAASENFLVVYVPNNAHQGEVKVVLGDVESEPVRLVVASLLASNLHPVANPAVDAQGNIFVTFSGSRGQKVSTSVFKITQGVLTPFLSDLMNPTGIAFNSRGEMFISSRFDGTVYHVVASDQLEVYAKGMGVATGIVFDSEDNLYVGDRSGTIFKIDKDRRTFVYATLEPSISAYHLALDAEGHLFVTGPTIGCLDGVHRINHHGEVEEYFGGLGRPQGMAFDPEGNLLVAASWGGQKGIVNISRDRRASLVVSGAGIVGLAFDQSAPGELIVVTVDSVYRLNLGWVGRSFTN
jgi:sugar lactone lactonase YvrE